MKLERDKLIEIEIFLADPNEQVRDSLRSIMRAEGLRRITAFGRAEDLTEALKKSTPDLLILSDDFDDKENKAKEKDAKDKDQVFNLVRDLRHFRLGINPFVLVTMLIAQENDVGIKKAVQCGADDVMIKPLSPGRLLERIGHLAFNRLPYIATTDYVGPERRRGADRPSLIPRLDVVNTLRDKVEGKRSSTVQLTRAVNQSMRDVLMAQLDSFHLKVAYCANVIVKSWQERDPTVDRKKQFDTLVEVIDEAIRHAKRLRRDALAELWTGLIPRAREIEQTFSLTTGDVAALQGLPKQFEAAKASAPAEEPAAASSGAAA